jgi:hypothetical protein
MPHPFHLPWYDYHKILVNNADYENIRKASYVLKHRSIKTYGGVKVNLQVLLSLAPGGGVEARRPSEPV